MGFDSRIFWRQELSKRQRVSLYEPFLRKLADASANDVLYYVPTDRGADMAKVAQRLKMAMIRREVRAPKGYRFALSSGEGSVAVSVVKA